MVLGLGSKGRKGKNGSLQVVFEILLVEIKPWQGLQSSKASTPVVLHWQRGDRHSGSTRSVVPQIGTDADEGKILFNASFKLPATLYRESTKKSNKTSGDVTFQEKSLVFCLLEANNTKGQPLARASLDLGSYGMIEGHKSTSLPLIVSKKVSTKGGTPNLLLRIGPYQKAKASDEVYTLSSNLSINSLSSRASDEYSSPYLDDHTRDSLVAALLSDNDEEIVPFTDDESPRSSVTPSSNLSTRVSSDLNEGTRSPVPNKTSTNLTRMGASEVVDARNQRLPTTPSFTAQESPVKAAVTSMTTSSAAQSLPVKAAAAAAAAAYTPKRSFLSRGGSSRAPSNDFSSEPGSPEDGGFSTTSSYPATSSIVASFPSSRTTVLASSGSDLLGSDAQLKSVKTAASVIGEVQESCGPVVQLRTGKEIYFETVADRVPLELSKGDVFQVAIVNGEHLMKKAADAPAAKSMGAEPQIRKDFEIDKPIDAGKPGMKKTREESGRTANESAVKLAIAGSSKPTEVKQSQRLLQVDDSKSTEAVLGHHNNLQSERKGMIEQKVSLKNQETNISLNKGEVIIVDDSKSKHSTKADNSAVATKEMTVLEEARMKFARGTDERNQKIERKAIEEAKLQVGRAEANLAAAEEKVKQLEMQFVRLKGELQDVAAVETSLYSVVAEHGSSSHKVHSPARRLARLYTYACKNWSQERRASCAINSVAGLVLVARACGHDVPRLTFWWSNAIVLRETVSLAFDVLPSSSSSPSSRLNVRGTNRNTQGDLSSPGVKHDERPGCEAPKSQIFSSKEISCDWRKPSTFTAALQRLEAWIYAKVVESVWWQAVTPQMQKSTDSSLQQNAAVDGLREHPRKIGQMVPAPELGDGWQGHFSVDLWKKAFTDAFERLCPVRAVGIECGCLPMLAKMIIEDCVARLDVAMFNAILRGSDDDTPTDPISDPISDPHVLPIPIGNLSFGSGAQLKNAVGALSTWLTNLLHKDDDDSIGDHVTKDDEKGLITFPLLKATGGLLMLPKDLLMDKSIRKEVCPALSLPLIRRIIMSFTPDEFSPDPVAPSLLAAINAEISMEKRMYGEINGSFSSQGIALAPSTAYYPPQSVLVREWIGDQNSNTRYSRSNTSLLRKSITSDDELDELESPISWLVENSAEVILESSGHVDVPPSQTEDSYENGNSKGTLNSFLDDIACNCRFQLLREVWTQN